MKIAAPYGYDVDVVRFQPSPDDSLPQETDPGIWRGNSPDVRPEQDGVAYARVKTPYGKFEVSGIRVAARQSMREAIAGVVNKIDFAALKDMPHIGLTSLVEGIPVDELFSSDHPFNHSA